MGQTSSNEQKTIQGYTILADNVDKIDPQFIVLYRKRDWFIFKLLPKLKKDDIITYLMHEDNAFAYLILGEIYLQDFDQKKALTYFQLSAERGISLAYHKIGTIYYNTNEDAKAFYYFSKGALLKDKGCMYSLGMMYWQGIGVERNIGYAVYYFYHSAEQGFQAAKDALKDLGHEEIDELIKLVATQYIAK